MKLLGNIKDKIASGSYKAVSAFMKKNYIGISKKYKDEEMFLIVERINQAIDDRETEKYQKHTLHLKARMMVLDMEKQQKGETLYCIYPTCRKEATHIEINKEDHIVYCDKHFEQFDKLEKEAKKHGFKG